MGKKINVSLNDDVEYERKVIALAEDRVGATVSVTKNLGDYNSLTIRFNWESDFKDGEDFDSASERVYTKVEERVGTKLAEYDD